MTLNNVIVCVLLVGNAGFVFADVHQPAKMMNSKNVEQQSDAFLNQQRAGILSEFKYVYTKVSEPKMVIFWNRKFDDQLSQWQPLSRNTRVEELSVSGQARLKSDDDVLNQDVDVAAQSVSSQYSQVKINEQQRFGFNESDSFDFASGFISTFLTVPAKLINRETIMRLMQRQNAKQGNTEVISDYQKVETDSLTGYADYFIEVLMSPDFTDETLWSFMVSVKSVSDGSLVAMFKTSAMGSSDKILKEHWVGTSEGYQKVIDKTHVSSPNQLGEQLAYETMQALTKAWQ